MPSATSPAKPPARPISSIPNLRDLGGLVGAGGRRIAAGRLYRSSHLHALTPDDEPVLAALGIRTVVDFRGVDERALALSRGLRPEIQELHLPIEPRGLGALRELRKAGNVEESAVVELMHNAYRRFVLQHAPVYAALLARLQQQDSLPLVFHCTAGKDRTGMAAVIILLALGVSREAIVQDFMLSNERWEPTETTRDWTVLSRVRAEYLDTAFETMTRRWGSIGAYLDQALALNGAARRRLAALLLEDPLTPA
ncbi:MAG TPA: tyrosine-protein phosphatase [Methylibium sp.]|jgi:protein-tyrosine phosphatase|nr:tyrosine-protein phosphatase [Methylibium sp.]